jgi:hypothetical protein
MSSNPFDRIPEPGRTDAGESGAGYPEIGQTQGLMENPALSQAKYGREARCGESFPACDLHPLQAAFFRRPAPFLFGAFPKIRPFRYALYPDFPLLGKSFRP